MSNKGSFFGGQVLRLPADIQEEIKRQFPSEPEQTEMGRQLDSLHEFTLLVGVEQLARGILILANGDSSVVLEIFASDFYGDPRDVLVAANDAEQSSNYGNNRFDGR